MARKTKNDKQKDEIGFLSRWSARKVEVSKGKIRPDDEPTNALEGSNEFEAGQDEASTDQEETLTDAELLEKYELSDPSEAENEAGLDRFLGGDLPERIRQMALRRLWHLNPLFGEVCEMVEYGEDYTDAATVIEGMQTAYQVGKGYETKAKKLEPSDVIEDDVAEDDVAEDDVAEDDVAEDDVAEDDVAEDDVAEDDVAKSDIRQKELADKIINFMEDGAVFKDNALGASGIDAGDYILPENDVVLPSKDKSDKDEGIVSNLREPEPENLLTNKVLPSEIEASDNASSEIVADGSEISEVTLEHEPALKPPMSMTRPSRMSFVKPGNDS